MRTTIQDRAAFEAEQERSRAALVDRNRREREAQRQYEKDSAKKAQKEGK